MLSKQVIPCGLSILLSCTAMAQNPGGNLKIDVDLVAVTATVTDSENRPVTTLRSDDFQVWEDKIEQRIESFSIEDDPISVGLIFDVSSSMSSKMASARDAAVTFLRNGNSDDEYFLIEFSNKASVTAEFSQNIADFQRQIAFTSAQGRTALYDAVYLGLDKVMSGHNPRKALLLITDGEDNHSRYTAANIREFLREKDVQVYAIGLEEFGRSRPGRTALEELAETSGGRAFFIDSVQDLENVCVKIAQLLKNQYVVAYRSTNSAKDGNWRKVRLKVNPPSGIAHLNVRSKPGYYAPASEARLK